MSRSAGVLARLGRPADALAAYAAALKRTPNDEGALHGRADVLAETGRRAEAAATLEHLAAVLDAQGRLADACDVARRALELAESRDRRKGRGGPRRPTSRGIRRPVGGRSPGAGADRPRGRSDGRPPTGRRIEPGSRGRRLGRRGHPVAASSQPPDPGGLVLAFEAAVDAGDLDEARRQAVLAAAGHRSLGQLHAAIDDCYEALAIAPADPAVHLMLAELYLDRGWRTLSADKLVLLGRLVRMIGDNATRARLCYLAATRFPDDARLAEICA